MKTVLIKLESRAEVVLSLLVNNIVVGEGFRAGAYPEILLSNNSIHAGYHL